MCLIHCCMEILFQICNQGRQLMDLEKDVGRVIEGFALFHMGITVDGVAVNLSLRYLRSVCCPFQLRIWVSNDDAVQNRMKNISTVM